MVSGVGDSVGGGEDSGGVGRAASSLVEDERRWSDRLRGSGGVDWQADGCAMIVLERAAADGRTAWEVRARRRRPVLMWRRRTSLIKAATRAAATTTVQ